MLTNLDSATTPAVSERDGLRPRKNRRFSKPEAQVPAPYHPTVTQKIYAPIRRVLDLTMSLVMMVIAGPIILLAALCVKCTSKGPAFYTQTRSGKNGQAFTIYKIRTMVDKCESLTGPRWTIPGDPRVTPLGWFLRRTHIDELPQLFNVLRGEMSLIGPRPERPEFVAELQKVLPAYSARLQAVPGITGLAQVQLAPDTDLESVQRKLRYDIYYVQSHGLLMDIRIMVATALHMAGMSFAWVQKLRLVPGPSIVEASPKTEVMLIVSETKIPVPRLHQQAA